MLYNYIRAMMRVQKFLDAAAVGLSGLCLIHCLALPVLAAFLPLLSAFSHAEYVHWIFLAFAAPIAAAAVAPTLFERPAPLAIAGLAVSGIALLTCGAFDFPTHLWGEALTIGGGLTLSSAHILNWRRRHAGHAHASL